MCTVVMLRRPDADWPLLLGANRDEMRGRPWRPPARHWDDRPHVVAGLDEEAGGTWMGMNDDGLVACVLNRPGSLGPAAGKRSRGELPLEALGHAEARAAADALQHLDSAAYRSFNMVVADAREAFWLRSMGDGGPVQAMPVPDGVSVLTAHDLDDTSSARIGRYLPKFRAAPAPDADEGDWSGWTALLADRDGEDRAGERTAMNVGAVDGTGFGTVSSSLVALPGVKRFGTRPIWLFCAGAPDQGAYAPVDFGR